MSLTPEEPVTTDAAQGRKDALSTWLRRSARTMGLILLIFVAWVWVRAMADPYGYLSIDPAVIIAIGLVGAGVLLLRGQQPAYEIEQTAPLEKEHSPLGVLTLSAAFLVVGALILIGNLDVADVTIGHLAAAALIVVATGLIVGAWWGRSRLLMVVGAVLVPFVIAGGFMHFPLRGSIGDRWVNTRQIDAVADRYELLVGTLNLNLADLRSFPGEREIDISIAAGNATIFIPERIAFTVRGSIEWGNATFGSGRKVGDGLVISKDFEGRPGAGHLTINFTGGIASLYVERISYRDLHGDLRLSPREKRAQNAKEEQRQPNKQRKDRRPKRAKT